MITCLSRIVIFLLIIAPACLRGAGIAFYVREGARGSLSGADWVNAYTNLPATLVRGAVYYLAGGSYGRYRFTTPPKNQEYLFIQKATDEDHGADAGWVSQYAATPAIFSELWFDTAYVSVNGATGNGNEPRGIKVVHAPGLGYAGAWSDSFQAYRKHHLRISQVEITQEKVFDCDGLYFYLSPTNGTLQDPCLVVDNCYVHHIGGLSAHLITGDYQVFTNNFMEFPSQSDTSSHKEIMKWDSTNCHVRISGNVFKDWQGYCVTGGLILGGGGISGTMRDWQIFNNVFYWSGVPDGGGANLWTGGNRAIGGLDSSITDHDDVHVWNNTFYNLTEANCANVFAFGTWTGSNSVINNLFVNSPGLRSLPAGRNKNAFYNTPNLLLSPGKDIILPSNPLRDPGNGNFALSGAYDPIYEGINLGAFFQMDKAGAPRPRTRGFVFGAFEPATTPWPPTNLRSK